MSPALARASGNLRGFGAGLGQVSKGVGQVAHGLDTLITRAAIAAGAGITYAVKSAIDFNASMRLIQTQAGASADEVTNLSKSVLALAPAVGSTPEELAAGLFHVESAGFRGAKALEVLTIAAEGAKVGNADLESVTNALTGAVNSGVGGITDIASAMGVLNAVVGAGNLRMEDLSQAFGTGILSTAKAFGVSIQSTGAAIADLARQGVPAVDAATRLRLSIALLAAPTPEAIKGLASIGIKADQLALDMRGPDGILGAVADLKEHLDASGLSATEQATLISHAFGGGRSSSAILALVGDVQQLKTVQDQVNASTSTFGDAWAETRREVGHQIDALVAGSKASAISFGEGFLPKLTPRLEELTTWLANNQDKIAEFGRTVAGGLDKFITEIRGADFSGLIDSMKIAGSVAKEAFALFNNLPPEIKAIAIGAFALNKVTGGAVGGIASGLGNIVAGLTKSILTGGGLLGRGASPANPLWVQSVGGIGGGIAGGGSVLAGTAAIGIGSLLGITSSVVLGALLGREIGKAVFFDPTIKPAVEFEHGQFTDLVGATDLTRTELKQKIGALDKGISDLGGNLKDPFGIGQTLVNFFAGDQLTVLKDQRDKLQGIYDKLPGGSMLPGAPGGGHPGATPKPSEDEKWLRDRLKTLLPNSALPTGKDTSYLLPVLAHIPDKIDTGNRYLDRQQSILNQIEAKPFSFSAVFNTVVNARLSVTQALATQTIVNSIRYDGKQLPAF